MASNRTVSIRTVPPLLRWIRAHYTSTTSLIENPHSALDKVDKPTPSFLAIPLEIRLQIFSYLFRADEGQICSHFRLPYLFFRPTCRARGHAFNNIFFDALLVNRQLYLELKRVVYGENLFYFEGCLPREYFDPPNFPQKMLAKIGMELRHFGFPLKFDASRAPDKEASIKAAERFEAEFKLLSRLLPNLSTTQVDLFCIYAKPCESFLVCLLRSCQLLHGKKIISVHGTNREKTRIAKIFQVYLNGCSDVLLLGGCDCIPVLEIGSIDCPVHMPRGQIFSREPSGSNGWPGDWIMRTEYWYTQAGWGYDRQRRWSQIWYTSLFLSDNAEFKGPRMGCLFCKLDTECVHDKRYSPIRKVPVATTQKPFFEVQEDWSQQATKARKGRDFRINWDQL